MRICILTLDFPPFRSSGLTIYAEILVKGLAREHAVTVVTARRPDHARLEDNLQLPGNVSIIRVPIGRADWVGFGWQAARFLRSNSLNFDIIHFMDAHFAYAYHGLFVASAFQSFRQRLTSYHGRPYHISWSDYLFRILYYNVARWMMEQPTVRRAAHIIMSSVTTQREFIEHYKIDPAHTTLIYPGIDLRRFEMLPNKAEARRYLGLPVDKPIILYVGFSTPRKGVEYLAQAMKRIKTPAYLVMVGKWEARYQERFLNVLGNSRNKVHITGYVPDIDIPIYYAAADIFVLPTLLEGFGFPLVEAMAAGLPVVTTEGGAASEIVGDGGLLVPPADSDALACAIDQVLNDTDLAHQLGQAGKSRARIMFDERRFANEIQAVYYRLIRTS